MNKYPSSIIIRMPPESFHSQQERDEYFDRLVTEINSNTDRIAQGKDYNCKTTSCKDKLAALNKKRSDELAHLDTERKSSVITGK